MHGSMTVLACVTMPGDDVTHPVPDNTGYITEGQLYLRHGRIEPFGSLSRLKQLVNGKTRDDHRAIMNAVSSFMHNVTRAVKKEKWVSNCQNGTKDFSNMVTFSKTR